MIRDSMSIEPSLNQTISEEEKKVVDTKENRLAYLQSKVVSYMISKRLYQLNADILVKVDECSDTEICLLVDDDPLPMSIDNQATGLGK